jgi:hypothetical protein
MRVRVVAVGAAVAPWMMSVPTSGYYVTLMDLVQVGG